MASSQSPSGSSIEPELMTMDLMGSLEKVEARINKTEVMLERAIEEDKSGMVSNLVEMLASLNKQKEILLKQVDKFSTQTPVTMASHQSAASLPIKQSEMADQHNHSVVPYSGSTSSASEAFLQIPKKAIPYTLLICGMTGDGKSTVVNLVHNMFCGNNANNLQVVIPTRDWDVSGSTGSHSESNVQDQAHSQTNRCRVYAYHIPETGAEFRVIDTPGLADTRGSEQDEKNINEVLGAAQRAKHITSLVLVINGSLTRMTTSLKVVIARLRANLPTAVLDNALIIFTNCTESTRNFKLHTLQLNREPPKTHLFYLQNSMFSKGKNDWTLDNRKLYQSQLTHTYNELRKLFVECSKQAGVSAAAFIEMQEKRNQVRLQFSVALAEMAKLQALRRALQSAQQNQASAEAGVHDNADFLAVVEVEFHELEPSSSQHNTLCRTHRDIVCHENCSLVFTPEPQPGNTELHGCAAMSNGVCVHCPGGVCGFASHFHAKGKWVKRRNQVTQLMQDMKDKYESSLALAQQASSDVDLRTSQLSQVEAAMKQNEWHMQQLCASLKRACEGFNFVDETRAVLESLKAEVAHARTSAERNEMEEKVRNLSDMLDNLNSGSYSVSQALSKAVKQLPDGVSSKTLWQHDSEVKTCHQCQGTFSMFNRKHHCRACGLIYCAKCTQNRATVESYMFQGVFFKCDTELKANWNMNAKSNSSSTSL